MSYFVDSFILEGRLGCFCLLAVVNAAAVNVDVQILLWDLVFTCFVCIPRSKISGSCCYLVPKSCLTLCDLMDCSPPGSSVHGIFQARILEWVAISFSRRSSVCEVVSYCGFDLHLLSGSDAEDFFRNLLSVFVSSWRNILKSFVHFLFLVFWPCTWHVGS